MRYVAERLAEIGRRPSARRDPSLYGTTTDLQKYTKHLPGTTEKPCTRCKIVKPLEEFSELKNGALGRAARCKSCICEIGREYTRKNREGKASRERPEVCDCCGEVPQRRALHWDHDHATDSFRGWLCHGCNIALGSVKDDSAKLLKLIDYLGRG